MFTAEFWLSVHTEGLQDGAYGLSSLSEKTSKSSHLHMLLQRQPFELIDYQLFKDLVRWSGQGSNTRPPARSSDTQPTQPIGWRRYAPDSAVQPLLTATYHQDPLFLTLCEDIPYWLKIHGEKHRPLTNNTCTSFKFFLDALNHPIETAKPSPIKIFSVMRG